MEDKDSTHLHREKYIDKGGPDGGDGGRGGHIIIRGNKNLWTLYHFKYKRHFKSAQGGNGVQNRRRTGEDGEDIYIDLPLGTVIRDTETGEVIFTKFLKMEKNYIIAKVVWVVVETGILKHLPDKHQDMHNQELMVQIVGCRPLS